MRVIFVKLEGFLGVQNLEKKKKPNIFFFFKSMNIYNLIYNVILLKS